MRKLEPYDQSRGSPIQGHGAPAALMLSLPRYGYAAVLAVFAQLGMLSVLDMPLVFAIWQCVLRRCTCCLYCHCLPCYACHALQYVACHAAVLTRTVFALLLAMYAESGRVGQSRLVCSVAAVLPVVVACIARSSYINVGLPWQLIRSCEFYNRPADIIVYPITWQTGGACAP